MVTLAISLTAPASLAVPPATSASAQQGGGVEPATPVLSVRRIPAVVARTVGDRRLVAHLDQALADERLRNAREHTCLAVADAGGRTLYSRRPETSLIPASTMKLVTAAVALTRMGPDARLTTEVRAFGAGGGAVDELWMVGGGDPLLATQDYAAIAGYLRRPRLATPIEILADRVAASGIRAVGRVVADESRYDQQRYVPSWKVDYITDFEITPMSALMVNRGFLKPTPPTPAPSPAAHAAGVLTSLLRARGVTVAGDPGEGTVPSGTALVASIESPPLAEVAGDILQNSDNLGAELLVKELGARFAGGGTTADGLGVIAQTLPLFGLTAEQVRAVDGSGLDRSDRLSCQTLQQLLAATGEASDIGARLPIAGKQGTLVRRFLGTPAEGRVRAKTGSLDHVVGLSGWAETLRDQSLRFSLLSNELPTTSVGLQLEDRIVNILVRYPESPPPEEIGPRPAVTQPGRR